MIVLLACFSRYFSRRTCTCVVVTEVGSYLRLIDSCITQLEAQGPSRTCNESKEEEEVFQQPHLPRGGGSVDRGTSLIRKRHPLGPYSRAMPRLLW